MQNYKEGEKFIYRGPLPIDGEVEVVKWEPEKWKAEGFVGNFRFKQGLVHVFSARHPSTKFRYVHPCQLSSLPTSE